MSAKDVTDPGGSTIREKCVSNKRGYHHIPDCLSKLNDPPSDLSKYTHTTDAELTIQSMQHLSEHNTTVALVLS